MKRVGIAGGPSVTICPIDAYYTGASWGENNTIVFTEGGLGLFRVQASGGQPERLAVPDATKGERGFLRPAALPGNESILHDVVLADGSTRIVARRLGGSDAVTVIEGAFGPHYLSRRLVFGQGDKVMATDFDAATFRIVGSPTPVASGVFNKPDEGIANIAGASDGTAVYVSGQATSMKSRLAWIDRSGKPMVAPFGPELEWPRMVRLSPDDRRVALTVGPPGQGQLWIYDLSGAAQPTKLTFKDHNLFPAWSPDGKQIAFLSRAGDKNHLLIIPSDGSTVQAETLLKDDVTASPSAWSPDGAFFLYVKQQPVGKAWFLDVRDHSEHQWLQTPFSEWGGRFSPDGRWVVFISNQTGAAEVWVRPFPGPGAPVRISPDGGQKPLWSKDGKEIVYENAGRLFSAPVTIQASAFRAEPPRLLFEGGFMHDETDPNMRYVDLARDGRLLIVESNHTPSDASIVVAQHWDAELKK